MILALVALLTCADPVAPSSDAGTAIVLSAGQTAPENGVFLPDALAVATGRRLVAAETFVALTADKTIVSTPVALSLGASMVAAIGAVFGAGVCVGDTSHCGTKRP